MTRAKICGVTTADAVSASIEGGASYLGFNFFAKSPRYIAPDAAGRLAAPTRGRDVGVVAITVDPDDEALDRIIAGLSPDFIQLHGHETPARAAQVKARTGLGVIKVISVSDASDIDAAAQYEAAVDHLMFDARPPKGSDLPGGVGAKFDWDILSGRRFQRPHFLAGGLDPWNVAEAARRSGAPIMDVSSGVERGAGVKDAALITAFLDAVKRA